MASEEADGLGEAEGEVPFAVMKGFVQRLPMSSNRQISGFAIMDDAFSPLISILWPSQRNWVGLGQLQT